MKNIKFILLVILLSSSVFRLYAIDNKESRKETSLNDSWSFILSDVKEASDKDFNDFNWRKVMIPHDWSLEEGYKKDGPQGLKGGYASGGVGWYRKKIELSESELKERRLFLHFNGVYMNSEVWFNGNYLGKRPYGYISFEYEITKYAKVGCNVISVRVDNFKEPSARWYHGCGIYSDVKLINTANSRLKNDGTFVANPQCNEKIAKILISSEVDVTKDKLRKLFGSYKIISPEGKVVYEKDKISLEKDSVFKVEINLDNPILWDIDNPALYKLETYLSYKGKIIDESKTRFGLRSIKWDTNKGFFLNGKIVKIKGVCEHLEGGPVGAAWPENLIKWKIMTLKKMGCNSIRTSHNPQVPKFYDLCDELGILVMDEIFDGWSKKAPMDYGHQAFAEWWEKDLRDWIKRDRNHPSVFIYSIGNETKGEIGKRMVEVCHDEDYTRAVTSGHSAIEFMDVHGANGGSENQEFLNGYISDGKPFIGTENPHTWQVRGYYRTKTWYRDGYKGNAKGPFYTPDLTEKEIFQYEWTSPDKVYNGRQHYNSSYDNAYVRINVRRSIEYLRDKPWYSGTYRWTGFDYAGECGFPHGGWPFRAFMGGVLDLAGFEKDHYYLYQSQWTDKPMAHMLPHWTHPYMKEGTGIPVFVYTNGEEVELFINGKSLGKKQCGRTWDTMAPMWIVPWTPGEIKAVVYKDGKIHSEAIQRTTGAPSQLKLVCEESYLTGEKEDLHVITMSENDSEGFLYPYGENRIHFYVEGGKVFSAESGCPIDTETNYEASSRKAFFGLLRAFVRKDDNNPIFYAGAIIGDKRLKTSNVVSIDVKALNIMSGKDISPMCDIYYTTDGSTPKVSGKQYLAPFPINEKGTVKAIVVLNGKTIMEMEEKFGPEEGIYWNESSDTISLAGQQAEEATLVNAVVENKIEGFQSKGYVVLSGKDSSINFYQENDGDDRMLDMIFSYMMEKSGTITVELSNGEHRVRKEIFVPLDKEKKWQKGSFKIKIEKGANNFSFNIVDKGVIAIDWFDIK